MKNYKRKEWLLFRQKIIARDHGACTKCGREEKNGAILHVHHMEYIENRLPWEYNYDRCQTLCSHCHLATHSKTIPTYGWSEVCCIDNEDTTETCQLCGTEIRYSFTIHHQDYGYLEVGTTCCGRLTGENWAAVHIRDIKRLHEKEMRFLTSSKWTQNKDGAHSIRFKGFKIIIKREQDGYRTTCGNIQGKMLHLNLIDAKKKIYQTINSGEMEKITQRLALRAR